MIFTHPIKSISLIAISDWIRPNKLKVTAAGSAPKAWRFVGEKEETTSAFKQANLPDQFHLGAAELYRRLEGFKDQFGSDTIAKVIEELCRKYYE